MDLVERKSKESKIPEVIRFRLAVYMQQYGLIPCLIQVLIFLKFIRNLRVLLRMLNLSPVEVMQI